MWISVAWVKEKRIKRKKKKEKEKWSDRDIATWKHRTRWNISRATSVICFRSFHSWPSLSAMRKIRLSTRWRPSALTDSKISHVTHAICLQLIAKFLYSRQEMSGSKISTSTYIRRKLRNRRKFYILFFIFEEFNFFQIFDFFFSISIISFWSFKRVKFSEKVCFNFSWFSSFFFFFVMFFKMDPQLRSKFSYLSHFSLIFFQYFPTSKFSLIPSIFLSLLQTSLMFPNIF